MTIRGNAVLCLLLVLFVGGCAGFRPTVNQYRTDFNRYQPTDQVGNWFVTARVVTSDVRNDDTLHAESPVSIALESHYAFKEDYPPRRDIVPKLQIDSFIVLVKGTTDTIPFTASLQPATYDLQNEHYLSGPRLVIASDQPVPDRLPLELSYVLSVGDPHSDSLMIRKKLKHDLMRGYLGLLRIWVEQHYPNPFSPISGVEYNVLDTSLVQIVFYNMLGKVVDTLVNDTMLPGKHEVSFGDNWDPGVYFFKVVLNGVTTGTFKAVFLK